MVLPRREVVLTLCEIKELVDVVPVEICDLEEHYEVAQMPQEDSVPEDELFYLRLAKGQCRKELELSHVLIW